MGNKPYPVSTGFDLSNDHSAPLARYYAKRAASGAAVIQITSLISK
jgi:hypothetical protein